MSNDILVKVGADISDFSRKMNQSSQALKNFGQANKSTFDAFSSVGSTLTKFVTAPAVAAATALTGITLVKGFQRLAGIDTARAKLGALGHDAGAVDEIMNNALDSVTGTAYGMDEAATAAASAVAAGIEPGKELTKYLSLAADTAAVAGTDFNEMGSIFNKVQTAQRAYTGDLNQLADRGIPIYQWLAEEAGTSAEAVRDMASRGEVSSEMFRDAIEKNIGGAAKEIGDKSFMAALANIGADIARIGANFLDAGGEAGGFFSTLKPLLGEFRELLQSFEGQAADLGVKFGEAFIKIIEAIKTAKEWFDGLSPTMQKIVGYFTAFASVAAVLAGPILMLIGFIPKLIAGFSAIVTVVKFIAGIFSALAGVVSLPFILIVAAVAAAVALIYFYWEPIKEFFIMLWEAVKVAGIEIWEFLKEVWASAVEFFVNLWEGTVELFTAIWEGIKEFFVELWEGIVETATSVWETLVEVWRAVVIVLYEVFSPIIDFFLETWQNINENATAAWDSFTGIITTVWEGIKTIASNVWEMIKIAIITPILVLIQMLTGDFEGAKSTLSQIWERIKGIAQSTWDALKSIVTTIIKGLITGIMSSWNNAKSFLTGLWSSIKATASNLWEGMKTAISSIVDSTKTAISNKWTQIKTAVVTKATEIVTAAREKFEAVKNGIRDKLTEAVTVVGQKISEMPGKVMEFFSNMLDSGKMLISGLINGIKSMAGKALEAVTGVVDGVVKKAKSLLNIKSPSRVFVEIGEFTGMGLVRGMDATNSAVERASERMTNAAIIDDPNIDMSYATPSGMRGTLSSAINGTVDVNSNGRDSALVGAINELRRDMTNLRVDMDGQTVGRITKPHIDREDAYDSSVRRYFD